MKDSNTIQHIKKRAFVKAFARSANVTQSAKASEIDRTTFYRWLKEDSDFAEQVQYAKEDFIESLEKQLDARIKMGAKDPHSHILLMFRLKKLDPSYREGAQVNIQNNVQVNNDDLETRRARIKAMILQAQEVQGGLST